MRQYSLVTAKEGTWDELLEKEKFLAFSILFSQVKTTLPQMPLRLVGFGPGSNEYSDENTLNELFDAYIFIKETTASNHQM